jgi:hypothetical protein
MTDSATFIHNQGNGDRTMIEVDEQWQRRVRNQPTVTFRLPNRMILECLNQHATEAGLDRSEYIRRALLRAMDSDEMVEDGS